MNDALTTAPLDWIRCPGCEGVVGVTACARSHVTLTYPVPAEHDGATGYMATAHCDPERVEKRCAEHDERWADYPADADRCLAYDGFDPCRPVWRPRYNIDLTEVQP